MSDRLNQVQTWIDTLYLAPEPIHLRISYSRFFSTINPIRIKYRHKRPSDNFRAPPTV